MGVTLNVAMFTSFGLIPIALALMLFYTYPAGVAVADVLLGHERFTPSRVAALVLSSAGVVLVLAGGMGGDGEPIAPLGIVLGLAAAASQVVFVTLSRSGYRAVPADAATLVILATSVVGASSIAVIAGQGDGLVAPFRALEPWPFILLAGIAGAGVSSLLFLTAIRKIGGTRTGILMLLEPVVGVVLAGILLGEAMGPIQAVGGALVLAGALVLQLRSDPDLEATVETASGPVV
jgi:drug/metabolite transporter (DMT)-like permease